MELRNTFTVPGRPDDIFGLLLDLERVALCMPGAALTGREGDEYAGTLKLKVGPIGAAYEGTVKVADVDPQRRTATLEASGRELTGQGGAQATIHANVEGNGDGSRVSVVTDVQIHGKAAQFGRGALGEVTQRIIDQFARNLEAQLLSGDVASTAAGPEPAAAAPPSAGTAAGAAPDDALDVLSVVVLPAVRKAAPVLAGAVLGFLLGLLAGRRRPRRPAGPPALWPGYGPHPAAWADRYPGPAARP